MALPVRADGQPEPERRWWVDEVTRLESRQHLGAATRSTAIAILLHGARVGHPWVVGPLIWLGMFEHAWAVQHGTPLWGLFSEVDHAQATGFALWLLGAEMEGRWPAVGVSSDDRRQALLLLGRRGVYDVGARAYLIGRAARSTTIGERRTIAGALAWAAGAGYREAGETLHQLAHDPDGHVSDAARAALGGPEVAHLVRSAGDPAAPDRLRAVKALGLPAMRGHAVALEFLATLARDPSDPVGREAALKALVWAFARGEPAAREILLTAARDRAESPVRDVAIALLADLAGQGVVFATEVLATVAFESQDPTTWHAAINGLRRAASEGCALSLRVLALLAREHHDRAVRHAGIRALSQAARKGRGDAFRTLISIAGAPGDTDARMLAIGALEYWARAYQSAALETLASVIAGPNDARIRCAAICAVAAAAAGGHAAILETLGAVAGDTADLETAFAATELLRRAARSGRGRASAALAALDLARNPEAWRPALTRLRGSAEAGGPALRTLLVLARAPIERSGSGHSTSSCGPRESGR